MIPTSEQEKIFNFIKFDSNHGIIDAVAGSGKTTTIINSIDFVQNDKTLLFCAFNKSIRDEIQERILNKKKNNIVVKNLHQLGFDILKSNSELPYKVLDRKYNDLINKSLSTYNERNIIKYLELYYVDVNPKKNSFEENILKTHVAIFKNKLLDIVNKFRLTLTKDNFDDFKQMLFHYNIIDIKKTPEKNIDKIVNVLFEASQLIIEEGNTLAKKLNIIDLSDMLYLPRVFEYYPNYSYDILFIDECQDLSKSQLAVALKYVKKTGRVIAVGDPFQSIYGFTGADIDSFERFGQILKNNIKLTLSFCFRCPNNVIEFAQNFRRDIKPFKDKNGIIEKIEFEKVINVVQNSDLIISRTKAPLTILLFILIENNKRVDIHQDDVKDLFNELKFLFTNEELNEINILKNNYDFFEKVKDRNLHFLNQKVKKLSNSENKEEFINSETKYIERRLNFLQRQISVQQNVINLNDLIKRIEYLVTDNKDAIKLSTIHKAKGLENERVFILDFNKLPIKNDNQQPWEVKQEINLKYVALTRAKHTLYLVDSIKEEQNKTEGNLFDEIEDIW
ncbi:ATP-dependent helicase [Flavobacterium sp. UBA7680]|uniref:ATP-dependent helicase n=1 Tax=Flavobacterium sp. UBA7680 TaxID=1946559 RepID=UPI0025BF00FA|nr:ATP-dependent helicase [Flavobacterium sp. UBA7680]